MFIHLKLYLATAIHNFMWEKKSYICLICDHTFANVGRLTIHFILNITVIWSANKMDQKRPHSRVYRCEEQLNDGGEYI